MVVLVPLVDDDRGGVTLPRDSVGKTTHDVPVEQRNVVCPVGGDEISDFDLVSHGSNLSSLRGTLHDNEEISDHIIAEPPGDAIREVHLVLIRADLGWAENDA